MSALDVSDQAPVPELFEGIQVRRQPAVLAITRKLRVASPVCEHPPVTSKGRVVAYGPSHRVFSASEHDRTKALPAAAPGKDFALGSRPGCRRRPVRSRVTPA